MRLSPETAGALPADIARYAYDRDAQKIGIVHFGIGAFHRAHQAWYTDLAMDAGDRDWAICGVSLRSAQVAHQLNPQGGLYTLTERSIEGEAIRLIGAVHEVLFAPDQAGLVIARIADPACHIVSFTVTEKGYARSASGQLDKARAATSFYPLLTQAIALRAAAGLPGLTVLSCDNLANNGRVLGSLMNQWLAANAPHLAEWFATECTTPATMIDRIVPQTSEEDLALIAPRIRMQDQAAVCAERFSQWVIEDNFAGPRPSWHRHGAQIVGDVAPYETAKLRMLNGAHSLLAYCGLRNGHEFVHQAIVDPQLRLLAERLMRREAAATIPATSGQDLSAYADQLIARFCDPALRHRLRQIAMDGSQKLPQRWLDTAASRFRTEGDFPAIQAGFDAWLWHIADGRFVDDPMGDGLRQAFLHGGRPAVVDFCFGDDRTVGMWPGFASIRDGLA